MAKKPSKKAEVAETPEVVEPVKADDKTVRVKNKTNTWFRQPATGIRIDSNEVKPMDNDGWLRSQVEAGFLELQ